LSLRAAIAWYESWATREGESIVRELTGATREEYHKWLLRAARHARKEVRIGLKSCSFLAYLSRRGWPLGATQEFRDVNIGRQ
jgi:hypothetical protein